MVCFVMTKTEQTYIQTITGSDCIKCHRHATQLRCGMTATRQRTGTGQVMNPINIQYVSVTQVTVSKTGTALGRSTTLARNLPVIL